MKKVKMVFGRKWFQKYDRYYHTFELIFDDKTSYTSEIIYGYGSQYAESARQYCIQHGYIIDDDTIFESAYVARKKDL